MLYEATVQIILYKYLNNLLSVYRHLLLVVIYFVVKTMKVDFNLIERSLFRVADLHADNLEKGIARSPVIGCGVALFTPSLYNDAHCNQIVKSWV